MPENNSSCINFFEQLFTDDVYNLTVNEAMRFERQKRNLGDNLSGNLQDFSIPELKACLGITLAMGLSKKINLKSYWSMNTVTNTPLFNNTMSRDQILLFSYRKMISLEQNYLEIYQSNVMFNNLSNG